jgi:hypothetical protein
MARQPRQYTVGCGSHRRAGTHRRPVRPAPTPLSPPSSRRAGRGVDVPAVGRVPVDALCLAQPGRDRRRRSPAGAGQRSSSAASTGSNRRTMKLSLGTPVADGPPLVDTPTRSRSTMTSDPARHAIPSASRANGRQPVLRLVAPARGRGGRDLLVAIPGTARIVQPRILGHRRAPRARPGRLTTPLPPSADDPAGQGTSR